MRIANVLPVLLLAAGVTLTFVGNVQAGPGGRGGACAEDRERLCPDAKRGEVRECLVQNQDQLSEACADRMEKRQQRREAFQADCGEDVAALCSNVEPGKRAVKECLIDNQDSLSDTCSARIAQKMEKRAAFDAACGEDLAKLCGDQVEGKRGKMRCLFEQTDALSDTCLVKLDEIRARHSR